MAFDQGTYIGVYEILAPLGAGGMGVVYRARDTRLDRTVALKFLPSDLTRDTAAKERFLREARVAASLDHPNVCTIYEVGEAPGDEAQVFIAMAHYEGETLKQRIEQGTLEVAAALDIASQIGHGLAKAHDAGIVHRDIKPANLIVTTDGLVKILDFGVAKLANDVGLTQTGTTLGTVAYMSPEQAAGGEIDGRSDLWALGVVLYEMLAGRTPFAGDGPQAVIHNLLNNDPAPVRDARPDVPASVDDVVRRALSKAPGERYQQATALAEELQTIRQEMQAAASSEADASSGATPSIAVLPFSNMSSDPEQEYFCDGLAEELIDTLAKLEGLKVVARTSTFQFKGQAHDIRRIGEQLGVRTVLEGSVRKAGNRLRITAQLINVSDGYHLWSERYDRTLDDIFAVQEEIARAIVERLKVELVGEPEAPLVKVSTTNLEAYDLLLEGRHRMMRFTLDELHRAKDCFERALAIEPGCAPAHAGMAFVHSGRGGLGLVAPHETQPKARAAAERALAADPACAEAAAELAEVRSWYDWDWEGAEQAYRKALALGPGYAVVHLEYGTFLTCRGRLDEGLAEVRRGADLDPLSPLGGALLTYCLYWGGRIDEAIARARKTLELVPQDVLTSRALALSLLAAGRPDEAVAALEPLAEQLTRAGHTEGVLGRAYARAGRVDEARAILDRWTHQSGAAYRPAAGRAMIELGLGEVDAAIASYEQAYRDRDGWCAGLARHRAIASGPDRQVYDDPRFLGLVRRIEAGGKEPSPSA